MNILHGTWIPTSGNEFIQGGNFYLWVETDEPSKQPKKDGANRHPQQLNKADLSKLLLNELGLGAPKYGSMLGGIVSRHFILPSTETQPQPSLELIRYLETEALVPTMWKIWSIECFQVNSIIRLLNDLHFLCLYGSSEIQFGSDLLFWYHYSQFLRELLQKDRYIPALKYREIPAPKSKSKKIVLPTHEIYPGWEIVSEAYAAKIQEYVSYLPLVCTGGLDTADAPLEFHDKETLLRHFPECLLHNFVANTPIPGTFEKKITNSRLPADCLTLNPNASAPWTDYHGLEIYKQWQIWKQKLVAAQNNACETSLNLKSQVTLNEIASNSQ